MKSRDAAGGAGKRQGAPLARRVPGMQSSDSRMCTRRVARCISARIDSDKDRAFWVSPEAIANSYPARATSCISEYLQRPVTFLPPLSAFWDATRASRTTSNFGHILSVDRPSAFLKQILNALNIFSLLLCLLNNYLPYRWTKVLTEKNGKCK